MPWRSRVGLSAVDRIAADLFVAAWEREVEANGIHRHPFHPSLDDLRRDRIPHLVADVSSRLISDDLLSGDSRHLDRVARISGLLTCEFASAALEETAAECRAVSEDDTFLTDDQGSSLVIQHRASGLRASFSSRGEGFGVVHSRPYAIASIDPQRPGFDVDWAPFTGLGIGTRLYRRAAQLLPDVRWASQTSTSYSVGLRMKLHIEDPFRWEGPCKSCTVRHVEWRNATRADFADHPSPPPQMR